MSFDQPRRVLTLIGTGNGRFHGLDDFPGPFRLFNKEGAAEIGDDIVDRAAHVDIDTVRVVAPSMIRAASAMVAGSGTEDLLDESGRSPFVEPPSPGFWGSSGRSPPTRPFPGNMSGVSNFAQQTEREVRHVGHGGERHDGPAGRSANQS